MQPPTSAVPGLQELSCGGSPSSAPHKRESYLPVKLLPLCRVGLVWVLLTLGMVGVPWADAGDSVAERWAGAKVNLFPRA